jgi:hypothetical protein
MSEYTDSVEAGLEGLTAVSTGACPGCEQCQEIWGYQTMKEFDSAWHSGKVYDEGGFSWFPCGICGSRLGGDRESWHALGSDGEILHFDDACVDCVIYLANNDEPEEWH